MTTTFRSIILRLTAVTLALSGTNIWAENTQGTEAQKVQFKWAVKIPMRDGIRLNATVYTPRDQQSPAPCIFTLTPYISDSYHDRGMYFAAHGFPFLTVDVRGRGNSEGDFQPFIQEAHDGYDVVEWLAQQPYCNGKVAMWGGSYAGYDQWATAKEIPPHLATIVPAAAAHPGVDFPALGGIFYSYDVQWLTFTSGHALQPDIFGDDAFWGSRFAQWFQSGQPFAKLDEIAGNPLPVFQQWLAHPHQDEFMDTFNPTTKDYARMTLPILTITGSRDDDQPGALSFYREFMQNASADERSRHYLIIGPWDHPGTRTPRAEFGGLKVGPHSLVDLPKLHTQWYAWTMQGGSKPEFLQKAVAYYVTNADRWRYADSLEAVTGSTQTLYLDSDTNATDVLTSGTLDMHEARGKPDHYLYDPRDVSMVKLEQAVDPNGFVDQRTIYAQRGKELVYHSVPFTKDTEISGTFRLAAWIGIDQPDTSLVVSIYEIRSDGTSQLLSHTQLQARYRQGLREEHLIRNHAPLQYNFDKFTFVSQEVKQGSRLRLVISPAHSIFWEKNYNSGGKVESESTQDARNVTVTLYHDHSHPSALYVPLGRELSPDEPAAPASAFSAQEH